MLKRLLLSIIACALTVSASGCSASKELPATAFPISAVENQVGLISFIDLGMGESTLIQAGTTNILIDAGNSGSYNDLREFLKSKKITTIDCLIVTNPADDYAGGAASLLNDYKVRLVLVPKWTSEVINSREGYVKFSNEVTKQGIPVKNTNYGFKASIGQVKVLSLGPQSEVYNDPENYSQILRFSLGGTTYLHMSGAGSDAEQELVSGRLVCQSDIIRTSRLSVKGSNSDELLSTVAPTIAIAPGSGRSYKNSRSEILDTYEKRKVELLQIRDHGTVTVATDGRVFGVTSEAYINSYAGEKVKVIE